MSRHVQVTFDAHDPRALSSFWRDVLGYVYPGPPGVDLPEDADPLAAWDDFLARVGIPQEQRNSRSAIEDPDGHGPRLFFQQVPEHKIAKNRIHLDIRAAPGLQGEQRMAALEHECDRLLALGATRIRRHEPTPPMSAGLIVMTDPEGTNSAWTDAAVRQIRPRCHGIRSAANVASSSARRACHPGSSRVSPMSPWASRR
jgi:hypothetical protein